MVKKLFSVKSIFWIYIALLFTFVIVKWTGSVDELLYRIADFESRRENGADNINLELFASIEVQLRLMHDSLWAVRNLVGNLFAFVPLGFLFPIAFNKRLFSTLIISMFLIILFEVFQYYTMLGAFDVDDIFLNMIGVIVGYVFYCFLKKA